MLQRIYGTAWANKKDLKAYLHRLEEAEKRDHRKIGRKLDLFHTQEEAPGMVFWHDHGWTIYQQVEQYVRQKLRLHDYQEVRTPQVVDRVLWEKSGHWEKFKDMMFTTASENRDYAVKPMNCPCHVQIFNQGLKSYRDLPLRMAEFGSCHRNEPSGTLHGLMRVRNFTQDDAHIFCTPEQVDAEIAGVLDLLEYILTTLGFRDYEVELSVWDPKDAGHYAGTKDGWNMAEAALTKALQGKGWPYKRCEGEAAFYGPKIDVKLVDALGRRWQCSTVQFDFNLPERFDLTCIGADSKPRRIVMIHRALFGSLERFAGTLIEHYAGDFPLWLSLESVRVLAVTETAHAYADKVVEALNTAGVRAKADTRNERSEERRVGKESRSRWSPFH